MLNIIKLQGYEESFNSDDPLVKLPSALLVHSEAALSHLVDSFVRDSINQVIPKETLDLYTMDGKALPMLDMNIELIAFNKRRVTIIFRGQELGHATFNTELKDVAQEEVAGGTKIIKTISHSAVDVWLRPKEVPQEDKK